MLGACSWNFFHKPNVPFCKTLSENISTWQTLVSRFLQKQLNLLTREDLFDTTQFFKSCFLFKRQPFSSLQWHVQWGWTKRYLCIFFLFKEKIHKYLFVCPRICCEIMLHQIAQCSTFQDFICECQRFIFYSIPYDEIVRSVMMRIEENGKWDFQNAAGMSSEKFFSLLEFHLRANFISFENKLHIEKKGCVYSVECAACPLWYIFYPLMTAL